MLAWGRLRLRICWALQWHVCRHMFCFFSSCCSLSCCSPAWKMSWKCPGIFSNSKQLEPGARFLCRHPEPAQLTGISGETSAQHEELIKMLSTQLWFFSFIQKCKAAKSISPSVSHSAGSGCRQWEAEPKGQHQNCPMLGHSLGLCSFLTCQPFTLSATAKHLVVWKQAIAYSFKWSYPSGSMPSTWHSSQSYYYSYYFSLVLCATTFFPVNDTFLNSSGWTVLST